VAIEEILEVSLTGLNAIFLGKAKSIPFTQTGWNKARNG
jgi:hypothetical protein